MNFFKKSKFFSLIVVFLLIFTPFQTAVFAQIPENNDAIDNESDESPADAEAIEDELGMPTSSTAQDEGENDQISNEDENASVPDTENEGKAISNALNTDQTTTDQGLQKSNNENRENDIFHETENLEAQHPHKAKNLGAQLSDTTEKTEVELFQAAAATSDDDENEIDDEVEIEIDDYWVTSDSVIIEWSTYDYNYEINEINIYLDDKHVATLDDDADTYTFKNLQINTPYIVKVVALTDDGEFEDSIEIEIPWKLYPVHMIVYSPGGHDFTYIVRGKNVSYEKELSWYRSTIDLPAGKFELVIFDKNDPNVSAAIEFEIETNEDYVKNPIELHVHLDELPEKGEPFSYEIEDVTKTSFTFTWNNASNVLQLDLEVFEYYGSMDPIQQITMTNMENLLVEGLDANTTYVVQLVAHYKNGVTSEFTSVIKTNGEDAEGTPVEFKDVQLENRLREGLGIIDRKITVEDLSYIYFLDLDGQKISSLDGLEHAENLDFLSADRNKGIDITALKDLKNIVVLYLNNNKLTNIGSLAELTNLQSLHLNDNELKSVKPLASLTALDSLDLSTNKILSIEALRELTKLEFLYLSGNQIENIEPLKELTNLRELYLDRNNISKLDDLNELKRIRELHLNHNNIEDITPLKSMTDLRHLFLGNNALSKLDGLENLTNLRTLELANNKITNIDLLKGLKNLKVVDLNNNNITNINALAELTNVVFLDLSYNNLTDIKILTELPNLHFVNLSGMEITDTATIQQLIDNGVNVLYDEPDSIEEEVDEEDETSKPSTKEELEKIFPKESGFIVGENTITVTVENKDSIRLSPNQLNMLKNNDRPIVVRKNGVDMEIPASIFSGNEHVEIFIEKLPVVPGSLSDTFKFTIKQGGKIISKFKDGITLTFEVDAARAKNPHNLKVFYLNEATGEWELIGGEYKNGVVTVTTNHFSIFTVFEYEGGQILGQNTKVDVELTAENEQGTMTVASSDGKTLPKTATNNYNVLWVGLCVTLVGILTFFLRPKRVTTK